MLARLPMPLVLEAACGLQFISVRTKRMHECPFSSMRRLYPVLCFDSNPARAKVERSAEVAANRNDTPSSLTADW